MSNKSEGIADLAAALAKAQGEMRGALADSENPHFKSRYADLASVWEACRGPLSKNGLSIMQAPETDGTKVTVTTLLMHQSGQWISASLTLQAEKSGAQSIASCISYARRYGLASMVGVVSRDDDAEDATDHTPPSPGKAPARPVERPKAEFPARSGAEAGEAMKKALGEMRGAHASAKGNAVSRKNAALEYLAGRFGHPNVRVALARIIGRTFPDADEITITMAELEKIEAFIIAEEASDTEVSHG